MKNNLKVTVNNQHNFDFTEQEIHSIDAESNKPDNYHILYNNTSYNAQIVHTDFVNKTYTIVINNNEYTVSIHTPLHQLIKEMGFETGKTKMINSIKAPMPGLILQINVEVGKEVKEGENLLILEAMKMENSFESPRTGIIKSILVEKGQAVEKGQLLIEFE